MSRDPRPNAGGDGQAREDASLPAPPDAVPVRGTEVAYYAVCPRKCWLFLHALEQERGSDLVALGRLTDETMFSREKERSVDIGGFARLDFTTQGIVHEVKHGPSMRKAHVLQVAYYLSLLKERGVETKGVLHYPHQRRKETVELTPALEQELRQVLVGIARLRQSETPPRALRRTSVCRSCAYDELCWCDLPEQDADEMDGSP